MSFTFSVLEKIKLDNIDNTGQIKDNRTENSRYQMHQGLMWHMHHGLYSVHLVNITLFKKKNK